MTAFTVVYIQLTESQVGAKYLQRGLMIMSESLEELKLIVDNAPEGATHYSNCESVYYKFKCECWMFCHRGKTLFEFVQDDDYVCNELRSLSDIKRIIELMEWQQSAFEAHPNIDIDMENL